MVKAGHLKYGGAKFKPLVEPEVINKFVRQLPTEKRESMFEVAKELESNKMIEIIPGEMSSEADDSCL